MEHPFKKLFISVETRLPNDDGEKLCCNNTKNDFLSFYSDGTYNIDEWDDEYEFPDWVDEDKKSGSVFLKPGWYTVYLNKDEVYIFAPAIVTHWLDLSRLSVENVPEDGLSEGYESNANSLVSRIMLYTPVEDIMNVLRAATAPDSIDIYGKKVGVIDTKTKLLFYKYIKNYFSQESLYAFLNPYMETSSYKENLIELKKSVQILIDELSMIDELG